MVRRIISISLALIGLLVGAGFATGQETIQYFISFGSNGIWGAIIAGTVIGIGGMVILQLGSYYMADEHQEVYNSIAHKWVSRFMDIATMITLFALGFVMLAGAGSTLEQQFGWPAWVGSTIMLILVLATGFLDIDRVSKVIGAITPLIIIAVIIAFVYVMTNLPEDLSTVEAQATALEPAMSNWFLSSINYAGLCLILAASMVLVIGGSFLSPREAGLGGLVGGICYTILLLMMVVMMYFGVEMIADAEVPTLKIFDQIAPWMALVVVWIIYAMIYNTCIGMFYALGRRLAAGKQSKFRPYFFAATLVGFAVSFVGFSDLMGIMYPILGYLGLVLIAVMVFAYLKDRKLISAEAERRVRIRSLFTQQHHPDEKFTRKDEREVKELLAESVANDSNLRQTVLTEVVEELVNDDEVPLDGDVEEIVEEILDESTEATLATETEANTNEEESPKN
ncbi:YkvI family membrane protein [Corynebacterium renale]|uniref:Putative membrane protein YkvI n=1 Tax=Corynebacterium renale TaxID=1724 RepID=A0A2A9DSG9_9CORY|nr:membrane protein [Corynebacterium renale]PFG28880.1 putative membrane protein YkvI [Corynebacterium renale]SQI25630.1 hypothetical membrane protein [Corynebacterium renale]